MTEQPQASPDAMNAFLMSGFLDDPYPLYAMLRAKAPIVRLPNGMLASARYEVVKPLLSDKRFGHDKAHSIAQRHGEHVLEHPFLKVLTNFMLTKNPPEHTRLRKLVVSAFSARRVEAMRGLIETAADEFIDRMIEKGEVDLMADFALPLPVRVICDMLDVPHEDRGWMMAEPFELARALDPTPMPTETRDRLNAQCGRYVAYFEDLLEARRAAPGDDLISAFIAADEDGLVPLSTAEIVNNIILLFLAGHETTTNLIGNGILNLHRHPEQLAWLRGNPERMPRAVEELLRFETPVQLVSREALEEVEFGGRTFAPGETLVAVIGAVNRDPAVFDDPDTLDLSRVDCPHLAFGGGIHYCLGAQLARIEGAVAFERLLARLPDMTLNDPENPAWRPNATLRGLSSLPATVG